MCADILCEILEGKLKVKTLLKWLLNQKLEVVVQQLFTFYNITLHFNISG